MSFNKGVWALTKTKPWLVMAYLGATHYEVSSEHTTKEEAIKRYEENMELLPNVVWGWSHIEDL